MAKGVPGRGAGNQLRTQGNTCRLSAVRGCCVQDAARRLSIELSAEQEWGAAGEEKFRIGYARPASARRSACSVRSAGLTGERMDTRPGLAVMSIAALAVMTPLVVT